MKKLLVSFSGGETSAYMTHTLLDAYADVYDMQVIFANTGEENEQTLEFVHECDRNLGFNTVWVEAVVQHGERKGTTFRRVTFDTAARAGEPYEDHIRKFGIPNMKFPHCTRELKYRPIHAYIASIGWTDYATAIGIRTDERRRVSKSATTDQIEYPLLDLFPSDKQDVNSFWESQPFRLLLKEHEGNCRTCWKKSDSKLLRLMTERPMIFDFMNRMEIDYPRVGAEFLKDPTARDRTFFRGNRSVADLRRLHAAVGSRPIPEAGDGDAGCGESCELYPTEAA